MSDAAGPKRDLVGYNGRPPKVVWPNNARIAISLVVNYEEGSEAAVGDGDPEGERGLGETVGALTTPGRRDMGMESMYEYGSRAGFWRLLEVLDEHEVKATFFVCAVALERNRDAAKAITARGHEPCSHGYRWEDVSRLPYDVERDHLYKAISSIEETTGQRPLGWYCRGAPSVHTRELVVEEGGFVYDSDAYNDDLPYWTEVNGKRHLVIPYSLDANDMKFSSGQFGSPRDFEEHLKYAFDRLYFEGATCPKMMSVGLHMRLVGRPARTQALVNFIKYAKSFPDVWFARRIEIARWWHEHYG
jgi:peptidoglycan/xylan/chitin deacetylase (PgdA/CDA1 family)